MSSPNNPAARLLKVLDRARDGSLQNRQTLETWMSIVKTTDRADFLRKFSKIVNLVPRTAEVVRAVVPEIEARELLAWEGTIAAGLDPVLFSATWDHATSKLKDPTAYALLRVCAARLTTLAPEVTIDDAVLAGFHRDIENLREQLEDLPEDVRDFIEGHLNEISDALDNYEFEGVEPVRKSVQSVLGDLILRRAQGRKTEPVPAFWTLVSRLADVVAVVGVLGLLSPGPSSVPCLPAVSIVDGQVVVDPGTTGGAAESDVMQPVASHAQE